MVFDWLAGGEPIQQTKKKNSIKYEYCVWQSYHSFGIGLKDLKEPNELGNKGWELVSVTTALTDKDPHDNFFFKRLKEE
ncbi:MAG: hypothetical protein P8L82_11170 [Paracoccaceae bacterium]|nr:hypothetical protein [Paracoccaceae bacterium]